jgi:raffinose/stachyose/melibiose transport system substrate-binding protein
MDLDEYSFNYFFSLGNTVWFQTQDGVQWKEDFIKGNATAADEESLVKVAEYYKRWIDDGFITSEHTSTEDFMENGDTVFFIGLGLSSLEYTAENGKTYEFGIMPWLSEDGTNNMLTRNVTRYIGVNKHLEEDGNAQKLEDALHVMEFISSEEGQKALTGNSNVYLEPLNNTKITEGDPYYEVYDIISSGHTVQMVYSGWEDIITPIAQKIRKYIDGEIGTNELLKSFDEVYEDVIVNGAGDVYGTAKETLTTDDTYKLAAIAEGQAAEADCAMVSVNTYHGDNKYNRYAVGWKLYAGKVNTEKINVIAQRGETISVLELTGAEIKELRESGFDLYNDGYPYEYRLFTKGDEELDDEKTYRLAVSTNELSDEMSENAETLEISPAQAIRDYITALGEFGADDIVWN